jgi:peptide deformylase
VAEPKEIIAEAIQIQKAILDRDVITPTSKWNECFAVAQPQVSSQPLRYFVLNPKMKEIVNAYGGEIIVNPRLLSKDKLTKFLFKEGCLSYPFRPVKKVKRYRKIEVTYVIIDNKGRITNVPSKVLEEIPAIVFQHELQHLNGKSIWSD